jgi:hypothetical protein
MTEYEILIAMAQEYASACLRSALAHEANDKGGFSEAQSKAWQDYDEANAKLGRIITSYPNHETIIPVTKS